MFHSGLGCVKKKKKKKREEEEEAGIVWERLSKACSVIKVP